MSMSSGYFPQQTHYGAMDASLIDSSYAAGGGGGPSSLMSSYSYSQYNASMQMPPPRSHVYTPSSGQHHLQQSSFYTQSDIDSRCFIIFTL